MKGREDYEEQGEKILDSSSNRDFTNKQYIKVINHKLIPLPTPTTKKRTLRSIALRKMIQYNDSERFFKKRSHQQSWLLVAT